MIKAIFLLLVLVMELPTGNNFYVDNKVYMDTSENQWIQATPASQGLNSAKLDSCARSLKSDRNFRALLVARHGALVYEKYNRATSLEARNIHLASKSILSLAVGKAISEGRLSLNTTVGQALGGKFSVPSSKSLITVKHLLTMTSGIKWTEDSTEYQSSISNNRIQGILSLGQAATPGTKFNYSTSDATLLSAVLTESVGQTYASYALGEVLSPAGITVEKWGIDPQGYYSGGCNFFITPREMLSFGQLALGLSKAKDPWIVSSTTGSGGYGYMWWADIKGGYRAWGWGKQFIYVWPSLDMVAVTAYDTASGVSDGDNYSTISRYVVGAVR